MNSQRIFTFGRIILAATLLACFSFAADTPNDGDITAAVKDELAVDNAVSANNIDVSTKDGVVMLTGTVDNLLAKKRAKKIAASVIGVRSIVNEVSVAPGSPRDDKTLKKAVVNALLMDPAADSYELKVAAENGVVTLSGTVDSYAEKQLSQTVAEGVKGVKKVNNTIDVDYASDRPDPEIKFEVAERLKNDVRVDDKLISVTVKNGAVDLSGAVGSLQERDRAYSDSWVAGVASVSTKDLKIEWWARDLMRRKAAIVSRTDEEIKKAVKDAFLYDPRVWSFNPEVTVTFGKVTLTGAVDNLAAKKAAEQDARNTLGVQRVKNQLKVKLTLPADNVLENRVATALLENPYVERFDINVSASLGWVYLSGTVNTSFEKNQAERVAEKTKGVVGVVNNITSRYVWLWKPDWEIRADVKDQLKWSPFVDEDDISVMVDDGIVTLEGTVPTWSEYDDAEKNAFQGGAKDVINNLMVTYPYYGPNGPGYYGSPNYHWWGYPEY